MYTDKEKLVLKDLLKAAYSQQVVEMQTFSIQKNKSVTRTVEPYSVIDTHGGTKVRCFQLAPEEGWRILDLRLIEKVTGTEKSFKPRRPVTIQTGRVQLHLEPLETRNVELEEYVKRVNDVLADMRVTVDEVQSLKKFRQTYGLTQDEARWVHCKILADYLNTVVLDGVITREEFQQIQELNKALHACNDD